MRRVHRLFSRYSRGFPAPSRRTFFCRRLRKCRCGARAAGLFPCFVPGQGGLFGGCAARNGRAFSRRRRFFRTPFVGVEENSGRSDWKHRPEESSASSSRACSSQKAVSLSGALSALSLRETSCGARLAECVLRCLPESLTLRTLPAFDARRSGNVPSRHPLGAVSKGGEGSPA